MVKFVFKVIDGASNESERIVEAMNEEVACDKVLKDGFYILSVKQLSGDFFQKYQKIFSFFRRTDWQAVSTKNIFLFTRQMFLLLDAGLPLVRCLRVLKEQKRSFLKVVIIKHLERDVLAGKKFSEALMRYPFIFKNLYVSMVSSGEKGGQLTMVVKHLSEFFEQTYILRKKLISSLFYPFLILLSVIVVIFTLLLFVVPKFERIFFDLNITLPIPTQILLSVSFFIKHYFVWIMLFLGFGFVLIRLGFLFEKIRIKYHAFVLRFPLWGNVYRKVEIFRFCRLMGMLLQNGVPILESFDIAKSVSKNKIFIKAFELIQSEVREGESVSKSFEKNKIFPSMLINMVDIGEESGKLDEMFLKISYFYEEDVKNMCEILVKMVEPFLIVILALVVGFIVISMFLPMLSMMSAMGR